jgi:hypothetical protein
VAFDGVRCRFQREQLNRGPEANLSLTKGTHLALILPLFVRTAALKHQGLMCRLRWTQQFLMPCWMSVLDSAGEMKHPPPVLAPPFS